MTTAEELRKYANEAHEWGGFMSFLDEHLDTLASRAEAEQAEAAKLRELILDMLVDEERGHNDDSTYYEHVRLAKKLGIEVD